MDELVNTNGRGQLGTATNNPISDGGTLARMQNRPNVVIGTSPLHSRSGSYQMGLTESDRKYIRDIHDAKHLDGTPLRLDELLYLRGENLRMQQEAARQFGPGSKTVAFFREVIAAYDEEIAKAKTPLGSAINAVSTAMAQPGATEKEVKEKVGKMVEVMHNAQVTGDEDNPLMPEGMSLLVKVVDRSSDQKTAALENLLKREQASPGSMSEDRLREATGTAISAEREAQILGLREDEEGQKKSVRVMQAVIDVIHVVSERRINEAKKLIEQEKKSMGSVRGDTFFKLIPFLISDERQKQLMGLANAKTDGLETVRQIFELVLKRRDAAVRELMRKQAIPGSGITNAQIEQAIADLDALKAQARLLGMAVPEGQVKLGTP